MDAKTTDVLEKLKSKYGEGRISEDQIFPKWGGGGGGGIDSYIIPEVSLGETMVFCRPMPTTKII